MSADTLIFAALKALVGNRVYPLLAPEDVARPYIVYQQVGGQSLNFLDATVPSKKNARIQVAIWGDTRADVAELAGQVEDTLRLAAGLQTTVLGQPVASVDPDTRLHGSRQDFSLWI